MEKELLTQDECERFRKSFIEVLNQWLKEYRNENREEVRGCGYQLDNINSQCY